MFIYSCFAQLISFQIDVFFNRSFLQSVNTLMSICAPPPQKKINYLSSGASEAFCADITKSMKMKKETVLYPVYKALDKILPG